MKNPFRLLETLEIPVSYFKNEKNIEPPYLIYLGAGTDNFIADNSVFHHENNYRVEYYFNRKDEELEEKIIKLFNDNEIIWTKSEDIYIDDENMFVIYFDLI